MKSLNKKIFLILLSILSLFLIIVLSVYNYNNYNDSKKKIENSLMMMHRENDFIPKGSTPPEIRFADILVYNVKISDKNILSITSHGNSDDVSDNVKSYAYKLIGKDDDAHIGNLYFEKFSYSIFKDNITIVDNSSVNENLINNLIYSLILFIVSEIVIILLSLKLTGWVCRPVEDSFQKQKDFIADASHELKTPLSIIMASAEALEKDMDKKWVKNILNESERMNKLIISLLDLAKTENLSKEKSTINLSKLVEKSALTFESVMFEKGIKLKCDIEDDIHFLGDSDEIKELMSILIDNAIKHSDGEVFVNLKKNRDKIEICVKNNGKEIPKEEEKIIFERFYKSDKSRNRNSNRYGLGLAIAKNIVNNHNGEISAHSVDGYTAFKVIFKN